jgi:hypothetical protein
MERRFGDWRLLADEYDHDNWLDDSETDRLELVLDAILVRNARFCPVLLTLINEREENIEGAGVITELLRFPGDPPRRWLDRRVLRDVVREARAVNARCDGPERQGRLSFLPVGAGDPERIRMSPCRLRVHLARFPGLWVPPSVITVSCGLCRASILAGLSRMQGFADAAAVTRSFFPSAGIFRSFDRSGFTVSPCNSRLPRQAAASLRPCIPD